MEEIKIQQWARKFYGGTTYSHKVKFIAHNDKYALFQKPPSTEYIGRFSGSVYAAAEWFVFNLFEESRSLTHSPKDCALFFKEGSLLKEDKKLLKEKYNLEVPKKEINRKLTTDKWIIFLKKGAGHAGYYFQSEAGIHKLKKDQPDSIIVFDKENEKYLSKEKYNIRYFEVEKEAINEYFKMVRLCKEHTQLCNDERVKRKEIYDIFKKIA